MIDGVGKSGPNAIGIGRAAASPGQVRAVGARGAAPRNLAESAVLEIASGGPPVDVDKVAAIRAAIAGGRYRLDADRIAERMIALDLPNGRR